MKSIKDQVDELHVAMAQQVPAEAMAIFGADVARFDAMDVPAGVLTVGTTVPNATVLDAEGNEVSFHSLLTQDQNVLIIYRGAWCPYCNLTLRAYQNDLVPALAERNVNLLAVSPQKPEGLQAMKGSHDLSFGVYSDVTAELIDAFGIWTTPSDEVAALQADFGMGVPESNVDGTIREPMPTTAILDRNGVVTFIDVHPNFTTRTEVPEILEALN
jgi:peroxiredoxin